MFRSLFTRVVLLVALCLSAVVPAQAELRIDINRGTTEPIPIAIPEFAGSTPESTKMGSDLVQVINNNLVRSGLFRIIDPASYVQDAASLQQQPRFGDWRVLNSQALVVGKVEPLGDGQLKVEFRLWDVFSEQQMTGLSYKTAPQNWRRIAHIISDAIYKRITGEDGYFDTRIVYISETGPGTARIKRLAIMDQDGENHKYLTDGKSLVLTPRFSPNSQEILYMSYANKAPRVFLRDLQSGQEESLGRFDGMSFAPRFSDDGNKAVMSIAKGGSTQIFTMDLRSRQLKQLTNTPGAINTSPSFSPDGSRIVFNSDRGGSQQLYVMDAGGGNVQRISFGSGNYGTPVWSPRGDLIAFTKMEGGTFYIGVMRVDGSGERMLANSFLDEGPTWSPNGRVIMFFRQSRSRGGSGSSRLYSVDLTGANLREVVTPSDASDPAWSPRLPM